MAYRVSSEVDGGGGVTVARDLDQWRGGVIEWARGVASALPVDMLSSDLCSVAWADGRGALRVKRGTALLPVVGDPGRAAAFDVEALRLANEARDAWPGVGRLAVYVGRLLVYAWAIRPEGLVAPDGFEAEVIFLRDGAVRADVARGDGGDTATGTEG